MKCQRVQNRLSEYVDGELPAAVSAQIRAHLAQCVRCRAEEEALHRIVCMTRAWGAFQAPAALERRMDPGVLAQASVRVGWQERFQALLPPAAVLAAGSAFLLALSLFGLSRLPAPVGLDNARGVRAAATHDVKATPDPGLAPLAAGQSSRAPASGGAAVPRDTAPALGEASVARTEPQAHRHEGGVTGTSGLSPAGKAAPAAQSPAPRAAVTARATASAASVPRKTGVGGASRRVTPAASKAESAEFHLSARQISEPIVLAGELYEQGQYNEAFDVLNDAFERSSHRLPDEMRALYRERNSVADADIYDCSYALRQDPGNVNARRVLDQAYDAKVATLQSLAG